MDLPAAPPRRKTVRHIPADWLYPFDVDAIFTAQQPVEVDLGCGKGRFLLAHAAAHPETNFLGIDRMLKRIRKIDHRACRRRLDNVRLMRVEGYYAVAHLLPPDSISAYYIFFPDPWPKKKHHDNRMFSPRFLDALQRTLKQGGRVHVATDHLPYFESIHEILKQDARFEEVEAFIPAPEERTDFELWYIDKGPIGRCSFQKR